MSTQDTPTKAETGAAIEPSSTEPSSSRSSAGLPPRIIAIDAYRGFVMLLMASAIGQGFEALSRSDPSNILWNVLHDQFEHLEWRGITIWDMIQPSFMFLAGVSLPFSMAARTAKGQGWIRQFGHALIRSLILVALGVFLASAGNPQTNFAFTNVLAQIGLGYPVLFLTARFPTKLNVVIITLILAAYWAWFALAPLPKIAREPGPNEVPSGRLLVLPFHYHWFKNENPASRFDLWFLNQFPSPNSSTFESNPGGYTTLNFVPSIATMMLGMLAGRILASQRSARDRFTMLLVAGIPCVLLGTLLDLPILGTIVCPMVKRIWTPSWALMSAGVAFWSLAFFYLFTDAIKTRWWAMPLVVVGANSIAFYLMAQLMKPWIRSALRTHLNTFVYTLASSDMIPRQGTSWIPPSGMLVAGPFGTLIDHLAITGVLWLIAVWMYRRKIFLRV